MMPKLSKYAEFQKNYEKEFRLRSHIESHQGITQNLRKIEAKDESTRGLWDWFGLFNLHHYYGSYEYGFNKNCAEYIRCHAKYPDVYFKYFEFAKKEWPPEQMEKEHKRQWVDLQKCVYYSLAGRNFEGAKQCAEMLVHEDLFKFPGLKPAFYHSGNALFRFLMGDKEGFKKWYDLLMTKKQKRVGKAFQKIFTGILENDIEQGHKGLREFVTDMKCDEVDAAFASEFVSTWPIGIANLCRLHGLWVPAVPPLVPEELLIDHEECQRHKRLFSL